MVPNDAMLITNNLVWETLKTPATKVSQGDLFYFEEESLIQRYGIVVTADCDLGQNKHARLVSLVPLLTIEGVLSYCLYIDHLESMSEDIAKILHKELKADVGVSDPAFSANIEAILRTGQDIPDDLIEAAKAYLHQVDEISSTVFKSLLGKTGRSLEKAFERFSQQISSRGDLLLLTYPPFAEHDVKIAWLRRMWQVNLDELVLRNSAYAPNKNLGQHVARLASPFRYRLTQKFGQVFSDIGTPDICGKWIRAAFEEKAL